MVQRLAEQRGWRAVIEAGNVDVALFKGEAKIACEILVTTPAEHDLEILRRRLEADNTLVVMVSQNVRHLAAIEAAASATLDKPRVRFFSVDQVVGLLDELGAKAATTETTEKGARIKTSYKAVSGEEGQKRADRISCVVARSLKRLRGSGK